MSRPAHASTTMARRLHRVEAPHHRCARTRRHRVRPASCPPPRRRRRPHIERPTSRVTPPSAPSATAQSRARSSSASVPTSAERACPRRPRRRRSPEPLARDARPLARELPPRPADGACDLGARALRGCPVGRAKPLRVAQRHDAGRPALRPELGPPRTPARPSRASPGRPTPTSTRPRGGTSPPARAASSSRSSTPESTTRTGTWPRTCGPIPATPAAGTTRERGRRRRERLRRRLARLELRPRPPSTRGRVRATARTWPARSAPSGQRHRA